MSAVSQTAAPPAVRTSLLALTRRLALPVLFLGSCTYQFLQGREHVAPTVFDDELLYSKLAQAIAAGHGLAIRGAHYAFPSPVASVLQAPAWLLGSMTEGYAAAKLSNAIVMSLAVFPAYWLARSLVRQSFALVVAAATVATPAMVYHAYLMSEAAAYPVFVLTVAVLVRAAGEPSRRLGLAVPAACALAVATRVQFLVLPLAFAAAVAVCGHRRRQLLPLGLLASGGAVLVLVPGALGSYGSAVQYHYGPGAVARWALTNASLLPFSLGLAVVPGALLGIGYAALRPRVRVERAFAVVTVAVTVAFLGQAALVSTGEAHRPLERYLFYVTPLVFTSFFVWVERGAPRRVLHLGLAGIVALLLSQVSLAGLTGTAAFFFDSVTESAYARSAYSLGLSDASLLFALLPVALALVAIAAPLRRPPAAILVAATAVGVQLWLGASVAATDHLVTHWARRTFAASPPNWLDRSGLGHARYLVLPDANPFLGTSLESWNRDITGQVVLEAPAPDPYARSVARVRSDGTLLIDEHPAAAQLLVANTSGTQIGLDGRVVARPRDGLTAYRIRAGTRVHWLARGLAADYWMGERLSYRVWRRGTPRGRYVVDLALPARSSGRSIEVRLSGGPVYRRFLRSGSQVRVVVAAPGARPPVLRIRVDVPPGPVGGRVFGAEIVTLRYEAS